MGSKDPAGTGLCVIKQRIMKTFKKEIIITILAGLLIFGGLFYWYEVRPSQIRTRCTIESTPSRSFSDRIRGYTEKELAVVAREYEICLGRNGLID